MAGSQAVSSVVQLSALTTITSIPREKTYNDFPVTVRVRARETTAPRCPPVDVVALVDVSGSMGPDEPVFVSGDRSNRLEHERKAMEEVARHFGGGRNRLAVVAFNNTLFSLKKLKDATDGWRRELNGWQALGDTDIVLALEAAVKILNAREEAEKQGRPAFIILLSDGHDPYFEYNVSSIPRTYPIHAFGFWSDTDSPLEKSFRGLNLGTYTPVDERIEKVTEKLGELSGELTSMLTVDTRVSLRTMHPGVTLSRVEPASSHGDPISDDKESGEVSLGVLRSGNEREFTVYLNVPEGPPGNGGAGGDDVSSMELLTVGGSYRQSWDDQQVALDQSVVAVARPALPGPGSGRCKELIDEIEKKLEHWCKVKQDLPGFNDSSRCQCCPVADALRVASLEAINIAMHQDIYVAVQHAIKLRHGGNGGTTMENAPSPTAV